VPHYAESRVAGRHRRVTSSRHRAAPALQIPGERSRTVVLTASLGAALVAGIAGGAAAAQAATPSSDFATATTTTTTTTTTTVAPDLPGDLAPAKNEPRVVIAGRPAPAGIPAAPVLLKTRELPKMIPPVRAAWVNPNPTARVTSCFGPRWGRLHAGVDLAGPDHSPIVAAGAGVVVRAGAAEGYGNAVLIDHGNGYLTHYGHLSVIAVQVGQRVAAGERIGDEGSTGHSTGPHLHFEVHEGYYKNPIEPTGWMHEHGVDIPGCVPLS
jgi:murein DD-endopeptidase MepM/ murein hydrolase activator NlpD